MLSTPTTLRPSRKQAARHVQADEARRAGDQDRGCVVCHHSRHSSMPSGLGRAVEHRLHVEHEPFAVLAAAAAPAASRSRDIILVRDREDHRVGGLERFIGDERRCRIRAAPRPASASGSCTCTATPDASQLAHDVDDLGIARVRHVFLERQAEHGDASRRPRLRREQAAHAFARDALADAVVDAAAGQDHLG